MFIKVNGEHVDIRKWLAAKMICRALRDVRLEKFRESACEFLQSEVAEMMLDLLGWHPQFILSPYGLTPYSYREV